MVVNVVMSDMLIWFQCIPAVKKPDKLDRGRVGYFHG